jgi:ABC-2 type transport system permease protein
MWQRIGALVRKEFIQLKRDRRTLAMMILFPVVWLVAFGYAVNFDVNHLHVFVVDQAKNNASQKVLEQVKRDGELSITESGTTVEARQALKKGEADIALIFPEKYDVSASSAGEQLRVWVDGSRLFTAESAVRKLNEVLADVQKERFGEIKRKLEQSEAKPEIPFSLPPELTKSLPPQTLSILKEQMQSQIQKIMETVQTKQKEIAMQVFPNPSYMGAKVDVLYNPDLKSVYYMVPGLLGLVLIFITTLMTALGVVKEKERGTLEQLIVSPLTSFELILGKLLPYMIIASVDFLLVFAVSHFVFKVPFTGDLLSYLLVALLFLFASLGLGLFVSTVSQNQQQAMQLAVLMLVPQFILSGFVFPLEAMPWAIRFLAYLMPLTYFLPISRDAFLKGMSAWDHPLPFAALCLFAVFFLLIATIRFRRSLT